MSDDGRPNGGDYMEAVAGIRSGLLSEAEALAGDTLLSIESCEELADSGTLTFITDNFSSFLHYLRDLTREEQDLLFSYYLLKKNQESAAILFRTTQTICSSRVRFAVQRLCAAILFKGEPSEEVMRTILTRAGLEKFQ